MDTSNNKGNAFPQVMVLEPNVSTSISSAAERFSRPRGKMRPRGKIRPRVSVIEASRRGRKQGNLGKLDLEALLEPCRMLLLGGSLNLSKEALDKNFGIS